MYISRDCCQKLDTLSIGKRYQLHVNVCGVYTDRAVNHLTRHHTNKALLAHLSLLQETQAVIHHKDTSKITHLLRLSECMAKQLQQQLSRKRKKQQHMYIITNRRQNVSLLVDFGIFIHQSDVLISWLKHYIPTCYLSEDLYLLLIDILSLTYL